MGGMLVPPTWLYAVVIVAVVVIVLVILYFRPSGRLASGVCPIGTGTKQSVGEATCRQVLEQHFRRPFPRVRPPWLVNPETGRALELDGFNEELQLAFEYNGIQHYVWPNWTGQSKEAFINQVRRDRYKMDTCKRLGVKLIVVPYTVKVHEIEGYIHRLL